MTTTHHRPVFGSESQLVAWHRECNALAVKMATAHAVAPLCRIMRADGRVLQAGDAVTLDDFAPLATPTGTVPPRAQLERAVRDGAVIARGHRYPIQEKCGPTNDGPEAA